MFNKKKTVLELLMHHLDKTDFQIKCSVISATDHHFTIRNIV